MKNNMLKSAVAVAALAAPAAFAGEPMAPMAPASSSAITADLTLGYHSDYNYRGVLPVASDDVFTFGAGITYADSSDNIWFADVYYRNIDTFGEGSNQQFDVLTDYDDHTTVTAGVRRELWPSITGTIAYAFNSGGVYKNDSGTDDEGHEVQLKLDWAVCDNFIVYGLAAYDFGSLEGYYLEAGAAYRYQVCNQIALEFSGALSGSFGYWNEPGLPDIDNNGLNHWELKVAAPIEVNEQLTLTPYVAYVGALDVLEDIADSDFTDEPIEDGDFHAGVEATLKF